MTRLIASHGNIHCEECNCTLERGEAYYKHEHKTLCALCELRVEAVNKKVLQPALQKIEGYHDRYMESKKVNN